MSITQDAICRSQFNCEAAYRCWDGFTPKCCWPPENNAECEIPGLPYTWDVRGNDPAGVSNNETLSSAQNNVKV